MADKPRALGKVNSRAIAKQWLELGVQTVPIKPRGKRPKNSDWPKLRVTKETISEYFQPGDNVGGLWGKPSNWVVDVDIDDDDAADLAENLLPPTFMFGRESREDTHYLYRCKGVETIKLKRPKGEMIVELRSTGSQTVLPGSIHPDNEKYVMSDSGEDEFTKLTAARLRKHLNELAVGAVIIKSYPEGGSRHDYVHAVTGALLNRWKATDVKRVMLAIIQTVDDDDPRQRVRTVNNTMKSYKTGERIYGWPTLKDWLSLQDIQALKSWIGDKDLTDLEGLPLGTTIKVAKKADIGMPFDKELLNVSGLVGEIIKWSARESYRIQPSFDLATALMCTALSTGNKYEVVSWNTPLQPYFMLVAPTAHGKGAPLKFTSRFAKSFQLEDHVVGGFQSHQALMSEFQNADNNLCWLWDEAGRKLKSAGNPTSNESQIITHLIQLYGEANSTTPRVPAKTYTVPALHNPFFTILANSQPQVLIDALTTVDLSTGFLNRLLLFDASDVIPMKNRERKSLVPSKLKTHLKRLINHPRPEKGFIPVAFKNVAAFTLMDKFEDDMVERGDDTWSRAPQNALIVAGIVAVGINEKKPVIDAEIASWAIKLVTWSCRSWALRVEDLGLRTDFGEKMKKVEQIIRDPKAYIKGYHRPGQQAYMLRGIIPRSALVKLVQYPKYILDDVVEQLVSTEAIREYVAPDGKTSLLVARR